MTLLAQDRESRDRVEILDRVSGDWFSVREVLEDARLTGDVFREYSYGYQERFVAVDNDAQEVSLDPFYTPTFILGCLEIRPCLRSKSLFLTAGDEEEIFLIESDMHEVSLSSISDKSDLVEVMDTPGEPKGFYRIERPVLDSSSATACEQVLRLKTENWRSLIQEWAAQYLSLIDFLLATKEGSDARLLLGDRKRIVLAESDRGSSPL